MVCAFGLPRYTATDVPPVSPMTRCSPSAAAAKASAQVVSTSSPSRRTRGCVQSVGVVVQFGEAGALRADEALAEHVVTVAAGAG